MTHPVVFVLMTWTVHDPGAVSARTDPDFETFPERELMILLISSPVAASPETVVEMASWGN